MEMEIVHGVLPAAAAEGLVPTVPRNESTMSVCISLMAPPIDRQTESVLAWSTCGIWSLRQGIASGCGLVMIHTSNSSLMSLLKDPALAASSLAGLEYGLRQTVWASCGPCRCLVLLFPLGLSPVASL